MPFPVLDYEEVSTKTLDPTGLLTDCLRNLHLPNFPNQALPDPSPFLVAEFRALLPSFRDNLLQIARTCSYSRRIDRHLTEEEIFLGTFSMSKGNAREVRSLLDRLRVMSEELFGATCAEISGGEDARNEVERRTEAVVRAWAAWLVALKEDGTVYGTRTFGWLVMGVLMSELVDWLGMEVD